MLTHLSETTRELPISPTAFGLTAFGVFVFLLYVVLRFDK
jgi:hypothetical protein